MPIKKTRNNSKINKMKGTLLNKEGKWFVKYLKENKLWGQKGTGVYVEIPLHLDSILQLDDAMLYPDGYSDEKEIEFEIVNGYEEPQGDIQYAKLIQPKEESNWDDIFEEYWKYTSIHSEIPIKAKNWLKEHYHPPVKK